MRVLVTGSRDWTDRDVIRKALIDHSPGTLIHGAARGADSIAAEVGRLLGYEVIAVPAEWGKHGRRAGPLRNLRMLDMRPDIVLAFPLPGSIGTRHCMREAIKRGLRVEVFGPSV